MSFLNKPSVVGKNGRILHIFVQDFRSAEGAIFSPIFANRVERGFLGWMNDRRVEGGYVIARESGALGRPFPGCDCCKARAVGDPLLREVNRISHY
jgi:hypothetical protein